MKRTPRRKPPADDLRVAEALQTYLAALEAGQRPDRQAFAARYADLAGPVAEALASLDFIEGIARDLPGQAFLSSEDAHAAPGGKPLGDFRIIREIGRGGMGVVYEAEQLSLGRRVALKLLPFAAALDPLQQRRFQLEAQVAAQLHHTNIVPVFAVGCERGIHFYAMQLINGQSLAGLIADLRRQQGPNASPEGGSSASLLLLLASALRSGNGDGVPKTPLPLAPRTDPLAATPQGAASWTTPSSSLDPAFFCTAAQLGLQAAEALDHAHQQGIVHRDIKPGNLLLDVHGKVWITDFGLARIQGEAGVTLTGNVLGTLRYVSPEQLAVSRAPVDARTDVYSLGVTLYELLTLRHPFQAHDRNALVAEIATTEPRKPSHWNRALPADLETILLKAIAKSPDDRYASAADLAEDLRRFLDDRPIRARRLSLVERGRRWAKRRKLLIGSVAATLFVSLLVSSAFYTWGLRREKLRADHHARLAWDAVDQLYTQFAERFTFLPGMQTVRKEFLLQALAAYDELSHGEDLDPQARFQVARATQRVGQIHQQLGDRASAEQAQIRAIRQLEELIRDYPTVTEYRYHLAIGFLMLSIVQSQPNTDASTRRAVDTMRALVADHPDDSNCLSALASTLDARADVLAPADRSAARECRLEAQGIDDGLHRRYPEAAEYARNLGRDLQGLGRLEWNQGNRPAAVDLLVRSVALRDKGLELHPGDEDGRRGLAHTLFDLGSVHLEAGQLSDARNHLERAHAIFSRAARNYPDVPGYQLSTADLGRQLVFCALGQGKSAEARTRMASLVTTLCEQAKTAPSPVDFQSRIASNLVISPFTDRSQAQEALHHAARAQELLPEHATDTDGWRGIAHYRLGDYAKAVALLESSVEPPQSGQVTERYFLAMALWRQGEKDRARQAYQKAVELQKRFGPRHPAFEWWRTEAAKVMEMNGEEARKAG